VYLALPFFEAAFSMAERVCMNSVEHRIMDAAERLFARRGFQQTTVQAITELAGCNGAAVSYYFGGKDALYMAVCRHCAQTLRDRCARGVERLLGERGETVTLDMLLWEFAAALLQPLLLDVPEGTMTLFLIRASLHPQASHGEEVVGPVEPIASIMRDALKTICPALNKEQTHLCIASVFALIHGIAMEQMQPGLLKGNRTPLVDAEKSMQQFVTFSAAGIRQYLSHENG